MVRGFTPLDLDERFERTVNRAASLRQRVVQTARALHGAAGRLVTGISGGTIA